MRGSPLEWFEMRTEITGLDLGGAYVSCQLLKGDWHVERTADGKVWLARGE